MEIKDLKPAWESFKVRNAMTAAHIYNPQSVLELLSADEHKSPSQKMIGAGVMLALIFFFCQGG